MNKTTKKINKDDLFLTADELAERWGINKQTLSNWRYKTRTTGELVGPAFFQAAEGHRVLYKLKVIEQYEKIHTMRTKDGKSWEKIGFY